MPRKTSPTGRNAMRRLDASMRPRPDATENLLEVAVEEAKQALQ